MTQSQQFDAQPVLPDDFDDVAKLLAATFGGTPSFHRGLFAYWWDANPAFRDDRPRGWLVRSPEREPIAFTANIALPYVVNGRPGACCATGSTSVSEHWRGHGLSRIVGAEFLRQHEIDLLIGTDSTPIAYRLWLGLGMRPLARDWAGGSYRIIANARRLIEDRARCPAPLRAGLAMAGSLLRPVASARSRAIVVRRVERFDLAGAQRIDMFRAGRVAATYAHRTADILDWLYFGCAHVRQTRAVFAASDSSGLIGYLAMKGVGHSYTLLECRCRDADPEIARALILAARDHADAQGAHFLNIWRYTDMLEAAVPRMGTSLASHPMMTYCYATNCGEIDEARWETTPGDGDCSLN
jgi:hypothetical protein